MNMDSAQAPTAVNRAHARSRLPATVLVTCTVGEEVFEQPPI